MQARGVHRATDRRQLIAAALDAPATAPPSSVEVPREAQHAHASASASAAPAALPGVRTLWDLNSGQESGREQAVADIAAVSQRLVELASLLGSSVAAGRVRIADMLLREPRLLTSDLDRMTHRLLALRIKLAGHRDTINLIEQHPNLLLDDADGAWYDPFFVAFMQMSCCVASALSSLRWHQLPGWARSTPAALHSGKRASPARAARACSGASEELDKLLPALSHGVASDTSSDWDARLAELRGYRARHGDVHCGFREGDERGLARWCKKQRASHRRGELDAAAVDALHAVGFLFDADSAEWQRWYNELVAFREKHGSTEAGAHTAHEAFYLRNWCSVQRVARRSGVIRRERIELLDELGFNWSAPDPLS